MPFDFMPDLPYAEPEVIAMSLKKPDTKIYLSPEEHAVLGAIADARGQLNSQLASSIVREWVISQAHAASVIAQVSERSGILRAVPVKRAD